MEKAYTYESSFHHAPHKEENLTLEDAIRMALVELELGTAWPVRIVRDDGLVIWKQSGPLATRSALKGLAESAIPTLHELSAFVGGERVTGNY